MPIYEYFCPQCKIEFELRLSISEYDRPKLCPKCNSSSRRLTSSFACKNGGNIQAAEKPFRQNAAKELASLPGVLITPPPHQTKLLSPPAKKSVPVRRKKK